MPSHRGVSRSTHRHCHHAAELHLGQDPLLICLLCSGAYLSFHLMLVLLSLVNSALSLSVELEACLLSFCRGTVPSAPGSHGLHPGARKIAAWREAKDTPIRNLLPGWHALLALLWSRPAGSWDSRGVYFSMLCPVPMRKP